jgi:hypothetical protein
LPVTNHYPVSSNNRRSPYDSPARPSGSPPDRALALWGYVTGRKTKPDQPEIPVGRREIFSVVVKSSILYALAYNLIFFIQELFLTLGKKWIGLKANPLSQ